MTREEIEKYIVDVLYEIGGCQLYALCGHSKFNCLKVELANRAENPYYAGDNTYRFELLNIIMDMVDANKLISVQYILKPTDRSFRTFILPSTATVGREKVLALKAESENQDNENISR